MSDNLSQEKRRKLLEQLEEIRNIVKSDCNNAELMSAIDSVASELKSRKYGLTYERHQEAIDNMLDNSHPVLTEDASLAISGSGRQNFLIEGDNLASLKLLEKTHRGKIDIIYIDPPYNTGKKDFIYDDRYIDSTDGYRHSKWLSFMSGRLKIARELLAHTGVIFISIDDHEQANLKLLCDEVFGEENFVANLIWKKGGGKSDSKYISVRHEYILIYRKSEKCIFKQVQSDIKNYKHKDEQGRVYCLRGFDRQGLTYTPSLDYPIAAPDNSLIYPGQSELLYKRRMSGDAKPRDWCWTLSESEFNRRKDSGDIVFKHTPKGWRVYYKSYYEGKEHPLDSVYDEVGNQAGSIEIKKLFDSARVFDFPKPVLLIKTLLKLHPSKSAAVLDFFAGSGTTGQAVMELNHEDGGNRSFILCTNNENNICRGITYERIKRAIEREGCTGSLKYERVEFVPTEGRFKEEYEDELEKHMVEMAELENGMALADGCGVSVALSDRELKSIIGSNSDLSALKKLYVGRNVNWYIYAGLFETRGVEVVDAVEKYWGRKYAG